MGGVDLVAVSYTHLDVYKRQVSPCFCLILSLWCLFLVSDMLEVKEFFIFSGGHKNFFYKTVSEFRFSF